MPRDLFRLWAQEQDQGRRAELYGELLSRVRLVAFGANAVLMPVVDVLVSAQILSAVPVSDNSHDLLYAKPGMPVSLARSGSGRLEVTGLSKRARGNLYQFALNIATGVTTPTGTIGYTSRVVTLDELATATSGGFGFTPLEALVLTDASGTILNVIA